MLIDLSLLLLFLTSFFLLWYRISLKIPELIAIPDQVITERLHEDSAKLRLFLLHIKSHWREKKYVPIFWKFSGKTLYRVHLFLLRTDNEIVRMIKNMKAKGGVVNGNGEIEEKDREYWKKLQGTDSSIIKSTRITEVRKKP